MFKTICALIFGCLVSLFSVCADETVLPEVFTVNPDIYIHYIHSVVSTPLENGGHLTVVELSDGTKWKFQTELGVDKPIYQFQTAMHEGREVFIEPHFLKSQYYDLAIAGEDSSFNVAIDKATYDAANTMPYVVKKERVKKKKGSWFKSAVHEYTLYLSDHSIWKSDKHNPFQEGDHLLISRSFSHPKKWYLMNVFEEVSFPHDKRYVDSYKLDNAIPNTRL